MSASAENIQALINLGVKPEVAAQALTRYSRVDDAAAWALENPNGVGAPSGQIHGPVSQLPLIGPMTGPSPTPMSATTTGAVAPTTSPTPILAGEQDQIAAALAASRATAEADEARRTAAVTAATVPGSDSGGLGTLLEASAAVDADLQRVLEESVRSERQRAATAAGVAPSALMGLLGSFEAVNPYDRARKEGLPPGLKNIGNTCYVNSIFQTLFHLPEFRAAVLAVRPSPASGYANITPPNMSKGSSSSTSKAVEPQVTPMDLSPSPEPGSVSPGTRPSPPPLTIDNPNGRFHPAIPPIGTQPSTTATPGAFAREALADKTAADNAPSPSLHLIYQLQKLFAFLQLSTRRYADPTYVLTSVRDDSGTPVQIGDQADSSEFHQLLLSRLEEGFADAIKLAKDKAPTPAGAAAASTSTGTDGLPEDALTASSGDGTTKAFDENIVKALFYGTESSVITTGTDDQASERPAQQAEFAQLILTVQGHEDLYSSIDAYTEASPIELGGASAVREIWLRTLPPVLTLNLQRVVYDDKAKAAVKVNDEFRFDRIIYMDRYLESSRRVTNSRRGRARALREQIAEVSAKLRYFTHYADVQEAEEGVLVDKPGTLSLAHEGASTPLDVILKRASAALSDEVVGTPDGVSGRDVKAACQLLEALTQRVSGRMGQLQGELDALRKQTSDMYSDMTRHPYRLHAVLVHEGVAGSGHYWVYICLDARARKWVKMSDIMVQAVSEEEVWSQSVGKEGSLASAYSLIYVDARRDGSHDEVFSPEASPSVQARVTPRFVTNAPQEVETLIPMELQNIVKEDNDALSAEMVAWDRKQAEAAVKPAVQKVMLALEPRLVAILNDLRLAFGDVETPDPKLRSMYHYGLSNSSVRGQTMALLADQVCLDVLGHQMLEPGDGQSEIQAETFCRSLLNELRMIPPVVRNAVPWKNLFQSGVYVVPPFQDVSNLEAWSEMRLRVQGQWQDYAKVAGMAVAALERYMPLRATEEYEGRLKQCVSICVRGLEAIRTGVKEECDPRRQVFVRILRAALERLTHLTGEWHDAGLRNVDGQEALEHATELGLWVAQVNGAMFNPRHRLLPLSSTQSATHWQIASGQWKNWVNEIRGMIRTDTGKANLARILQLYDAMSEAGKITVAELNLTPPEPFETARADPARTYEVLKTGLAVAPVKARDLLQSSTQAWEGMRTTPVALWSGVISPPP